MSIARGPDLVTVRYFEDGETGRLTRYIDRRQHKMKRVPRSRPKWPDRQWTVELPRTLNGRVLVVDPYTDEVEYFIISSK